MAEDVIERPALHHQDNDGVDVLQFVGHGPTSNWQRVRFVEIEDGAARRMPERAKRLVSPHRGSSHHGCSTRIVACSGRIPDMSADVSVDMSDAGQGLSDAPFL